jgi:hypothetical protein
MLDYRIIRLLAEAKDDHGDEHQGEDESAIKTVKIFVCVLLLFSGCFVFFPFLKSVKDSKAGCCKGRFFSLLTCFAAGMLLTISIVHVMPEAVAIYGEYLEEHEKEEAGHDHRLLEEDGHDDHDEKKDEHAAGFPLPYVIFLLGFMLMLLLD